MEDELMVKALFPEVLSQGSQGPVVFVLQIWLKGIGFTTPEMRLNGKYDEETFQSIIKIQHVLKIRPDGKFGHKTKEAIKRKFGIDFDKIPDQVIRGETIVVAK